MEQIDYDIDDFLNYCEVKNLSKKTINSYEQTLRLFAIFLKNECSIQEAGQVREIHITSTLLKLISSASAIFLKVLSILSGSLIESFTLLSLYLLISNILPPQSYFCTKCILLIPYKKGRQKYCIKIQLVIKFDI